MNKVDVRFIFLNTDSYQALPSSGYINTLHVNVVEQ